MSMSFCDADVLSFLIGSDLAIAPGFGGVHEDADLAILLVTTIEQLVDGQVLELSQGVDQKGLEVGGGLAMVSVSAAERFGDHLVDDAESEEIPTGHLERSGGLGC